MSTRPKIILYDLETTHNLLAAFRLLNDDMIPFDNIVQERYIVCAAWKELDKSRVHSVSTLDHPARYAKNPHDDYHVCKVLHAMIDDADILVAHNGDDYDLKFLEGRLIAHGFPPLAPTTTIDTLKVARRQFLFNSNRLDYLGKYLGVGRKTKTEPGLWMRVLNGEKAAVRAMVRYNKGDVLLLEAVFKKLRPFMAHYPHLALWDPSHIATTCPRCGSGRSRSKGLHRALTRIYQRRICLKCGGHFRNIKAEAGGTPTRVI